MLTSNQTQKLNLSSAQIMTTFGVPDELKFIGIRITDNGSGMTPEIAEKTKEPFITSKPPGTGKGIGLNMVDRFVTESQGHISIAPLRHFGKVKIILWVPI